MGWVPSVCPGDRDVAHNNVVDYLFCQGSVFSRGSHGVLGAWVVVRCCDCLETAKRLKVRCVGNSLKLNLRAHHMCGLKFSDLGGRKRKIISGAECHNC